MAESISGTVVGDLKAVSQKIRKQQFNTLVRWGRNNPFSYTYKVLAGI
jgi:hypothetical protein